VEGGATASVEVLYTQEANQRGSIIRPEIGRRLNGPESEARTLVPQQNKVEQGGMHQSAVQRWSPSARESQENQRRSWKVLKIQRNNVGQEEEAMRRTKEDGCTNRHLLGFGAKGPSVQ
jgi:hypothetical protein